MEEFTYESWPSKQPGGLAVATVALNGDNFSEAVSDASGISVDVKVPKATAPWGCRTDRQGKVQDVHFKGSEGAL